MKVFQWLLLEGSESNYYFRFLLTSHFPTSSEKIPINSCFLCQEALENDTEKKETETKICSDFVKQTVVMCSMPK